MTTMSETTLVWEDIGWGQIPIKHCEFIRSTRRLASLRPSELEEIIGNLTLGSLCKEDYDFVLSNLTPTIEEAYNASKETRVIFLHNLLRLLSFGYRKYKIEYYKAIKEGDITKVEEFNFRVFQHYEAIRNLKKSLIAGKDLLYRDMPIVEIPK